ncbi:MAG: hypothetical protein RMJ87_09195 [Cytophagales bacterium]|nr:DUF3108 domain-containing protein [Bernardetiaceae bacterium]MDW8205190.1 hypothetical protein [Cytophagales bacterium]
MKPLLLLVAIATVARISFAQQNACEGYFPFQEGKKVEMTTYDKKDKPLNVVKNELINKTPAEGGFTLVYKSEMFDAKGKLLSSGEFNGRCADGTFYCDIRNISYDAMPKGPEFEVNFIGEQIAYPSRLEADTPLSDASVKISSALKGGMPIMNMSVAYTNRKVEGLETVETPAGKFECVKVSYNLAIKIMGTRQMKGVEYLAKGIGIVKSELYDEKGKKESTTLLTKLN